MEVWAKVMASLAFSLTVERMVLLLDFGFVLIVGSEEDMFCDLGVEGWG